MKYIFSAFVQFFLYTNSTILFHVKSLSRKWRHNNSSQITLSWNKTKPPQTQNMLCFHVRQDSTFKDFHTFLGKKETTQSSASKPSKYFGICPLCSFPTRYAENECSVGSALHICKMLALSSLQWNLPSILVCIKLSSLNYMIMYQNRMSEMSVCPEEKKRFCKVKCSPERLTH